MSMHFLGRKLFFIAVVCILAIVSACGQDAQNSNNDQPKKEEEEEKSVKIGLSVVDLTLERWQHDRDIFTEKAEELGAEVIVQSADGDADKQLSQLQNMLSQDVDALVIIAANSDALTPVVEQAKEQDVVVVAYDRLFNNADIDAYVSFDNIGVGEMQAEYLTDRVPEGKYFLLGGEQSDHTAHMFREGQMNVLQPLIDSGDIEVVGDQWADEYSGDEALSIIENALTAQDNDIDVVVAPNDSTAGGVVQALEAQNLAGDVLVSGQDADLSAVRRIAEGTQSMTVYKPIRLIAETNAEVTVDLVKGNDIDADDVIDNDFKDVPYVKLDPISVDKENLVETIIEDGFHSYEEVYEGIPEEDRPPKP